MRAPYLVAMALALAACSSGDDDPAGADGGCPVTGDGGSLEVDGGHFVVDIRPASGTCRYQCALGWGSCPDAALCGVANIDDNNCGACGRRCGAGGRCAMGSTGAAECFYPNCPSGCPTGQSCMLVDGGVSRCVVR